MVKKIGIRKRVPKKKKIEKIEQDPMLTPIIDPTPITPREHKPEHKSYHQSLKEQIALRRDDIRYG